MSKRPTVKEASLRTTVEVLSSECANNESPGESHSQGASRIMYIECKAGGLTGAARIGRVLFSKTGKTIYYRGMVFRSLKGAGYKSNYFEVETGAEYWISGPRKDGADRLYGERLPIEIDEDVAEEYWHEIRRRPEMFQS